MSGAGGKNRHHLVVVTQLGLAVTASAAAGLALGANIDRRLDTRLFAPVLLLVGLGLGFAYAYHVLSGVVRDKS